MDLDKNKISGIFDKTIDFDTKISKDFEYKDQFIALYVGDKEFLISISNVQEIIMFLPVTFVPNAQKFIEGVINLRGTIIPAVNLRKMMGMEKGNISSTTRIIIISYKDFFLGLLVDGISYVMSISKSDIESDNQNILTKGQGGELIYAISKHNNKLLGILDIEKIINTISNKDI
jgi:purine-binding chemotaxis protein CheW